MDEQLKRRLMGATIIVTLSVIFVPMLFEDTSEGPATATPEAVPALPEAIEQHTIELPKSAADVAAEDKPVGKEGKKPTETGYRVIPLEDAPTKPVKAEPPVARQVTAPAEDAEVPVEEEGSDEGGEVTPPPAKPQTKAAAKEAPKAALTAKGTPAPTNKAKPVAPAARPTPTKKPAPTAAEPEESPTDVGEEPEFTPAEAPPAKKVDKPKPLALVPVKPATQPTNKLAPPAKPAEARPPAKVAPVKPVATPKPVPPVATINPPPAVAKSQEPKPAAAPEAAAPTSWSVQAGSFTGEANARTLVDKLRKVGLSASMQVSQGQAGPVYRVAVGAGTSRAQAEQVHKQIESAVGIKGIIQSHR